MQKKYFIAAVLLILAVLLSACGFEKNQPLFNFSQDRMSETTQVTSKSERKAATIADFKKALSSIGYIETSDFELKYGCSIKDADKSLINSVMKDGVIGVTGKCFLHFDDVQQYMSYSLADLATIEESCFDHSVSFIVFTDEAAAIAFLDDVKDTAKGYPEIAITEDAGNHYSKIIGQTRNLDPIEDFFFGQAVDTFIITQVGNTILLFEGTSNSPAYQVADILGY